MPALKNTAARRTAPKRQTQPGPWIKKAGGVNVTAKALEKVVLIGGHAEADLTNSITAAPINATRSGVAQLTLEVADPDLELLTNGRLLDRDQDLLLDDNIDVQVGGIWWRLMGMQPTDTGWTLALEDRSGAWLRRHDKPMKAVRGRVNRAAFIRRLYQQAGGGIDLFVPELLDRQRRAKTERPTGSTSTTDRAPSTRSGSSARGWPASAKPKVKGVTADSAQLAAIVDILTECARHNCSRRVMIAALMAPTQESRMGKDMRKTGNDDTGFYQQGREWISEANTRKAGLACRAFLLGSEAKVGGTGGTRGWKQRHGSLKNGRGNLSTMCGQVQLPRSDLYGEYGKWEDEATRTVDLWLKGGGAGGAEEEKGGSATATTTKPREVAYEFERGQGGKREDSLACATRLAGEVGWRHWVFGNTGVYASDVELVTAPVGLRIRRDDPAVLSGPRWKWDVRHTASEATAEILVESLPEPGQVVTIENEGPATGRWMLASVSCDLAQPVDTGDGKLALRCTVTLARAQPKQIEPPNGTASTTSTGTDQGASSSSSSSSGGKLKRTGNKVTGGTARERIVFAAKESARLDASGQRKSYYLKGGTTTVSRGITGESGPPIRSDCSQWVLAMYWSAGLPAPDGGDYKSGYTGSLIAKCDKVTSPLPGDLCFYGTGSMHHVELYVGNGKTIGHGSAPVDYATPRGLPGFAGYWRPRVLKGLS